MRSRNEEKPNASKNYGITERKDLENLRELIGHEAADKWAGWPVGGAGRPHMSSSCVGFSHGDS